MKAPSLLNTLPIPRRKVKQFIDELKQYPIGTWSSYSEKNARGDYGYDEHFFFNKLYSHTISIDGARQDVRFYRAKKDKKN